jgi:hypothetical protein
MVDKGVKMSVGTARRWTLQVLLETTWESAKFASREAAMVTLESILSDYGNSVAMAYLISPISELQIANLHGMRSQLASITELTTRHSIL